jgi:hypothetical protein
MLQNNSCKFVVVDPNVQFLGHVYSDHRNSYLPQQYSTHFIKNCKFFVYFSFSKKKLSYNFAYLEWTFISIALFLNVVKFNASQLYCRQTNYKKCILSGKNKKNFQHNRYFLNLNCKNKSFSIQQIES